MKKAKEHTLQFAKKTKSLKREREGDEDDKNKGEELSFEMLPITFRAFLSRDIVQSLYSKNFSLSWDVSC